MTYDSKFKLKPFIISILIPLAVGFISSYLSMDGMNDYNNLVKPDISPPNWVFPIVWTILYILMGISSYIIYKSNSPYSKPALKIYAIQLIVNGLWSIIFFNYQMYLLAFIWLILLIILVVIMMFRFSKISKVAAYLQIPYLIWLLIAGYLNFSVYLLNR